MSHTGFPTTPLRVDTWSMCQADNKRGKNGLASERWSSIYTCTTGSHHASNMTIGAAAKRADVGIETNHYDEHKRRPPLRRGALGYHDDDIVTIARLCAIGTGGGLPGIPLAILFPQTKFTLIDSTAKKIKVVNEIINAAGIRNVLARAERSEEITGQYDFIVGRAVAETDQFVKLTRHLSSPESFNDVRNGWILLKGGDLEKEIAPFRSSVEVIPLSAWFDEPYFETKKIVYLPR